MFADTTMEDAPATEQNAAEAPVSAAPTPNDSKPQQQGGGGGGKKKKKGKK